VALLFVRSQNKKLNWGGGGGGVKKLRMKLMPNVYTLRTVLLAEYNDEEQI
jgi:hypothetical protein